MPGIATTTQTFSVTADKGPAMPSAILGTRKKKSYFS
jgi:hypothetical protein